MGELKEKDVELRKKVVELDGVLKDLAKFYGISPNAMGCRLRTTANAVWWDRFRARRSKQREKARRARSNERARKRSAEFYGSQ
jgi:hypothetical protein